MDLGFRCSRLRAAAWPPLLLAPALLLAGALSALELSSMKAGPSLAVSKDKYWRYELVEFSVARAGSSLEPSKFPQLFAKVRPKGGQAAGLPGREIAVLSYEKGRDQWRGSWPIPWNPPLGAWEAELLEPNADKPGHTAYAGPAGVWPMKADPYHAISRAGFKIQGKEPAPLPKGFCAMTLEPGKADYSSFPGIEGEKPSWYRLLEWTRFIQADAFWHSAAHTATWGRFEPQSFPFPKGHLTMARLIAGEAKVQGIAYGAYVVSFRVEGDFEKIPHYQFTTGYSTASSSLEKLRFVSVGDALRKKHLAAVLSQFEGMDGVAYLGMDYVRNNTGGLEFTDEFLSDMAFLVPQELKEAKFEVRQKWLGNLLAQDTDAVLENLWDWWRAHKVAAAVAEVLEAAKVTKPLWVFTLGWKTGHQHGQDNFMFIDAGASFTSPMFYELDQEQFGTMLDDWKLYLGKQANASFVIGQPVDSPLLHNKLMLNGPEEHYRRQLASIEALRPRVAGLGLFWHDINRALAGGRGPDSMREWAIAGAASFSRLREAEGVVPVALDIRDDAGLSPLGVTFTVRLTNLSSQPIPSVRLSGISTSGLRTYLPKNLDVPQLMPGESREVGWMGEWSEKTVRKRYEDKATDMRMLAVRAVFPGMDAWRRPAISFRYVGDRSSRLVPKPLTPSAQAIP